MQASFFYHHFKLPCYISELNSNGFLPINGSGGDKGVLILKQNDSDALQGILQI